jgi:unsaturated rhamnogalacturonyl hydrolase
MEDNPMTPRTTKISRLTIVSFFAMALFVSRPITTWAQAPDPSHSPAPLHRTPPDYPIPYGSTSPEAITKVLNRVHAYLDAATPISQTRKGNAAHSNPNELIEQGDFRIISYEWGVTYSGMLLAGEATGDSRFMEYAARRLELIVESASNYREPEESIHRGRTPLQSVLSPQSLDDSGSMCAAMIKAHRAGLGGDLRPLIDNYMNYISAGQYRLEDGTLARNRPQPNALWLDDLYMSVPALAQMGKLTAERRYYDDAVRQILQFADRMFVKDKGLYMHGWVKGMDVHPVFHWARANGWAIMAKVELLEVLPEDHPGRRTVLDLLRTHIRGLADRQSGMGLWHQLLDRNDTYLETSASAMFVYSIARAINRGWIDPLAYGPIAQLGWNAVTTKVNEQGQVEGTCVGTGMGFDPTFYYYRPRHVLAAHGYGPVLLAGAEMIQLLKDGPFEINDSSVQLSRRRRTRSVHPR